MNKNIFEMKAREYGITPIPEDATVVMAYVPYQMSEGLEVFSPERGICAGTMFPELDKPFTTCGCGGEKK